MAPPTQFSNTKNHIDPRRTRMSTAKEATNKAAFMRLLDAVNTGDEELMEKTFDEIIDPDALIPTPFPVQETGPQGVKALFGTLRRAFPDLHLEAEDVIAEGDKVVVKDTVTGTHRGEFMGNPPTGKEVAYNEIFIVRFVNGRMAEASGIVDVLSLMKQLGVIPA
jgi:predicted ester cyclase